jgi:hypothetical protein
MKLKGEKKLNKAIKTELIPFGIEKVTMADWCWRGGEKKTVEYTLLENRMEDRMLLDFVKERFNFVPINEFMFSLFHELGHNATYDNLMESDAVYNFCQTEKDRIENELQFVETKEDARKLEYQYFNLPDEIIATQWAVDYMKKNKKKIKKMWKRIEKEIVEFYRKNLDTEE